MRMRIILLIFYPRMYRTQEVDNLCVYGKITFLSVCFFNFIFINVRRIILFSACLMNLYRIC